MKTILIPIDFTRSSNNAIIYAVEMSRRYPIKHIILAVSVYVTEFEQLFATADFIQFSMDKVQAMDEQLSRQFEELKLTILKELKPDVRVSFILSKNPLIVSLREIVIKEKPDLIILGSNHASGNDDSFISDHLIKIAKTSTIPVLIVPSQTRYQKVEKALVPFNFSNIGSLELLNKLGAWAKPDLLLLNVEPAENQIANEGLPQTLTDKIKQRLPDYNCRFYVADDNDVLKATNHFSYENELQLIVALPGKHSFLYNLTHRNIIKALSRNNYKPVLILKNRAV